MSEAPVDLYTVNTVQEAGIWLTQKTADVLLLSGCVKEEALKEATDFLRRRIRKEATSILRGMRFLCAEDNELNAEILKEILQMYDAACTIYPNGEKIAQAFQTVKEGEYDAVLMDIQMPKMNSLEVTKAIRSGSNPLGRTIPIIAMTANTFSEDVEHCIEAGMDPHIAKPTGRGELAEAIPSSV